MSHIGHAAEATDLIALPFGGYSRHTVKVKPTSRYVKFPLHNVNFAQHAFPHIAPACHSCDVQPIWDLPLQAAGIEIELPTGDRMRIRPVRTTDGPLLEDAYERLSEESRYLRFFTSRSKLGSRLVSSLTDIDHTDHFAWAVFDPEHESAVDNESGLAVASARLIRDDDPTSAEAALAVVDDYQGKGIGRFLIELLVATAADVGATQLRFEILRQNRGMIGLIAGMGATGHAVPGDRSVVEYILQVPPADEIAVPAGALYALLRHAAQQADTD